MADTPSVAPGTTPAAPAPAPAPSAFGTPLEPVTGSDRIDVIDDDATQPGEPGDQPVVGAPGALPADVHPAVREERERARKYRDFAEQAFVFNDQGEVVGIREDFARGVASRLGGVQPDANAEGRARYQKVVESFADRMGLLPNQVEAFIELAEGIAQQRAEEAQAPFYATSADVVKQQLIASGEVPAKAAPFVAKWIDESIRLNPKAALTPAGRETVLRQALGEYVLQEIRARRVAGGNRSVRPVTSAPNLLRPGPSPAGARTPDVEEQKLRRRFGLPATYTENTPMGEEGR